VQPSNSSILSVRASDDTLRSLVKGYVMSWSLASSPTDATKVPLKSVINTKWAHVHVFHKRISVTPEAEFLRSIQLLRCCVHFWHPSVSCPSVQSRRHSPGDFEVNSKIHDTRRKYVTVWRHQANDSVKQKLCKKIKPDAGACFIPEKFSTSSNLELRTAFTDLQLVMN